MKKIKLKAWAEVFDNGELVMSEKGTIIWRKKKYLLEAGARKKDIVSIEIIY